MRTRPRGLAVLVLPLALTLGACAKEQAAAGTPDATPPSSPAAAPSAVPKTAEDFLGRAEKAMEAESVWSFSVKGQEELTLHGQRSAATYEGTVRRGMATATLHTRGISTSSKGRKKTEELFVEGDAAHLKEGSADWRSVSSADPAMRNKADDPVAAIHEFRSYAQAAAGDVKVTETIDGTVELRVKSGEQKLSAVQDRQWAKKAKREFDPTAVQLRKQGVRFEDGQLTLSGLEEMLVLDAKTYRIRSYRLEFGFLIPYNGADILFEQQVDEENEGSSDGKIERPASLR
ncbi:hypothetical protein ACFTXJ_00570 [Streptomyces zhihengii]|uniref:hypothetical protein n=1 Tax=Streptomyces zhihengii TaxID=1818004 RepID=UPI0036275504